jgi:hypothetical protein
MDHDKPSSRTRIPVLLGGLAALAATALIGASALSRVSYKSHGTLIEDQLRRRGAYIASNLAMNSNYGVLTEDGPLLRQLIDAVLHSSASGETNADVVGVAIRNAKGVALAQNGVTSKSQPPTPSPGISAERTTTADGDDVFLFHAPVHPSASSGPAGSVEVAISTRPANAQRSGMMEEMAVLGLLLSVVSAAVGFGFGFYLRSFDEQRKTAR